MPEAPEIPRVTDQEHWRSNVGGTLRGIRGDLDLLVMQETPPEAVEFGYFHHLGLPHEDHGLGPLWPQLGLRMRSEMESVSGTPR